MDNSQQPDPQQQRDGKALIRNLIIGKIILLSALGGIAYYLLQTI